MFYCFTFTNFLKDGALVMDEKYLIHVADYQPVPLPRPKKKKLDIEIISIDTGSVFDEY